jgi:transposase
VGRRCIGLDVHREFAQVAVWEDGLVRQAGRIALSDEALRIFADSLGPEDEVAIEATCNTQAVVRLLEPHVARVVVSNPQKTRAIAEAKVKTDKSAWTAAHPRAMKCSLHGLAGGPTSSLG